MVISQELYIFLLCSSIIGLTFACLSIILASYAAIKVVAMEKSTHTIQYVDPEIEKANKEFLDEWATTEESLEKQEAMTKAEIADDLEFFSEKDSEKFSF